MCGITVSIALGRRDPSQDISQGIGQANPTQGGITTPNASSLERQLSKSLHLIAHRGPDAMGVWVSADERIGLGHCRLSINDLTPAGEQPLHSPNGRIHAVVNGELYDPGDALRTHLSRDHDYAFSSHSDSELAVALYQVYGAPEFLTRLRGEFALVLYDEATERVVAARDRFGIKPLFWTVVGENSTDRRLLIAAEAKAFLPLGWEPEWDVGGIAEAGWAMDDRTVFKGVRKVLPGCWMEVLSGGEIGHHRYWDIDYRDKQERETRSIDDMILGVREHLVEATRLRLRADVPVGIYLSGGIDSSLLAGIATQLVRERGVTMGSEDATKGVCCFSVEFPQESGFNESDIAERTAEWLGVRILKKRMDEAEIAKHFADSVYHCEHHNFDLNSVGKFALSMVPREHGYKVVLTGEGADEHFAGYPFFFPDHLRELDLSLPESPPAVNPQLIKGLQEGADTDMKAIFERTGALNRNWTETDAVRAVNRSTMLSCIVALHPELSLFAPWAREDWVGTDCRDTIVGSLPFPARQKIKEKWHPLHTAEYMWSKTMLANNLLSCLGDRTEMAHSIEARPPFLDHIVSEYINGLPPSVKVAYTLAEKEQKDNRTGLWWQGQGAAFQAFTEKWILRQAGRPFITKELYERRKHPYAAPVRWPRGGPLNRMFEGLLTEEAVDNLGFVDYEVVKAALETSFGDNPDSKSFRTLIFVASWVVISQRFGVKRAGRHGQERRNWKTASYI